MSTRTLPVKQNFAAARNACKLCTPLGACLALSGIDGAIPLLHGSQGCSTYIRRFLISHFREPMDIASSNFGERAAIFGGSENLQAALGNVAKGYSPSMIGVCTTCLSETIGDDVPMILREFTGKAQSHPILTHASTPSYRGTHFDGFVSAIRSVVDSLAQGGQRDAGLVNVIPGMVSPADVRHLKEIVRDFGLRCVLLPDYAQRLDGPSWSEYHKLPAGGTTLDEIRSMGSAAATLELSSVTDPAHSAGGLLESRHGVPRNALDLSIGIGASDELLESLSRLSGRSVPAEYQEERGRLVDSYVDAHKYVFDKRAVIYGEEDLVIALARFCCEIGVRPVLCASGGHSGKLAVEIARVAPECGTRVMEDVDFEEICDAARDAAPDLLIGSSKGLKLSRDLQLPLVRVGFPIHDRIGASRVQTLGYRGTQQLFDRIVNTLLERMQDMNEVGYSYI